MAERTSVFARFWNRAAADTLASYVTARGFFASVSTISSAGMARYCVMVASERESELRKRIAWTQVSQSADPLAVEIVLGRLVTEGVAGRIAGRAPLDKYGVSIALAGFPYSVEVPQELSQIASRILADAPFTESELTELALRSRPP